MEIKFQRESAAKANLEEVIPLLEKHYAEIAHFKNIALEPDFEQYNRLEELGFLRSFTARTDAGELVGYAVYFVRHNLHYKSSLQALQDIIFIDPTRRGFGHRFIAWCDEQLKAEGVQVTVHHVKQAHNWGPMLERMGYRLVDLIFAKEL